MILIPLLAVASGLCEGEPVTWRNWSLTDELHVHLCTFALSEGKRTDSNSECPSPILG